MATVCEYCRCELSCGIHDVHCPLRGPIGPLSERRIRQWYDGYHRGSEQYDSEGNSITVPIWALHTGNYPGAFILGYLIGWDDTEESTIRAVEERFLYEEGA